MAEAFVIEIEEIQPTPLRVRLRQAFHSARSAVLPRRWVIRWEMREIQGYYATITAEARARRASADEIAQLESEAAHFHWELEEELEMLESSRLLRRASNYLLPTPSFSAYPGTDPEADPNWRRGTTFRPDWYLKREAMQDLRLAIRSERKARWAPVTEAVKLVGGAGGVTYLLKTLIGLFG